MIGWFKRKAARTMTAQIVGSILRAGLAAYGGANVASDSEINQIAGAVAVIVTVAWSIYSKWAANNAKA